MNLIEQINDLCTKYEGGALALSVVTDLRAIIEQAKREAVEPVARVTALSNLGFSTMGQVEWIGNKYSLSPDALLYASPQPDHTKLIWELVGVLERAQNGFKWFVNEHPDDVDEDDIKLQLDIDALLTKARESIK